MTVRAYYSENDPFAAQWLRNLIAGGHIAPGDVDERSIVDVKANAIVPQVAAAFLIAAFEALQELDDATS